MSVGSLKSFCHELFHPDHGTQYKHGIIINKNSPERDLELFMSEKRHENLLHYLEGEPSNDETLMRADISKAKACIIFINKNSQDPYSSDHQNLMLALYIKKLVYNLEDRENEQFKEVNFRLCMQLIKPESKYHYFNALQTTYKTRMPADQLIIIEEIKMSLLAKSCIAPGIMSLITNLVMSSSKPEGEMSDWLRDYSEGRTHEMYRTVLHESYRRNTFKEIASDIYSEYQAIAFGLEVEIHKNSLVMLNPNDLSVDGFYQDLEAIGIITNRDKIPAYIYIICSDKSVADEVDS